MRASSDSDEAPAKLPEKTNPPVVVANCVALRLSLTSAGGAKDFTFRPCEAMGGAGKRERERESKREEERE